VIDHKDASLHLLPLRVDHSSPWWFQIERTVGSGIRLVGRNGFALPSFMTPILEAEASLAAQNQITIPAFLNLLTRDIKENPQRIRPFPVDLLNRARSVVENVEVDLKGPLTGED
jgi:hypothetical protein